MKFVRIILTAVVSAVVVSSVASPARDNMDGRYTGYSTGIPNVAFVEYLESDGYQFIDIYTQSGTETRSASKLDIWCNEIRHQSKTTSLVLLTYEETLALVCLIIFQK